jgi:hypothetical protein
MYSKRYVCWADFVKYCLTWEYSLTIGFFLVCSMDDVMNEHLKYKNIYKLLRSKIFL